MSLNAPAEWNAANGSHVATVAVPGTAVPGDRVDVWVDDHGDQVAAPTPASEAADYAVCAAALMWLVVVPTRVGLWALIGGGWTGLARRMVQGASRFHRRRRRLFDQRAAGAHDDGVALGR